MLEFTALLIIAFLYVIPLNLLIYHLSNLTVSAILESQSSFMLWVRKSEALVALVENSRGLVSAFFYILYVLLIFIAVYVTIKYIVVKSIYVYSDNEIQEGTFLLRYKQGQRSINGIAIILIGLLLLLHLLFRVFDVKLFVFAFLCLTYIYRAPMVKKASKVKEKKQEEIQSVSKNSEENNIEGNSKSNTEALLFEWFYNMDSLGMQLPVRFIASLTVNKDRYEEYQNKEHLESMPTALREHVLEGICPEIVELARQIKKQCIGRGLTTFHQVSAVMSFQQSLKYVYDIDSKGCEEYIRYPLETLVDKEGDCDCHSICSAALLHAMGYDVALLRIVFPKGDGHLALAVEGADGIPGNFFEYNHRTYYYCEVTPAEQGEGAMNFKVGEMPDMPGANITVVPVKEIISQYDLE